MVSWDIVIALMIISFTLPFIFLRTQMRSTRLRIRSTSTELQHTQSMLHEMEHHLQKDKSLFLEALGVPFLLLRPSGRIVMANTQAGQLLHVDSSYQMNLIRMLPESPLRRFITRAAATEEQMAETLRVPHHTNGESVYMATATPLGNKDRHIGIVFLDVTEEHKTQIIRRDFVANASHELRTPLTLIQGYLETLLEDPETAASPDQRERALRIMKKHADRMTRLVADMLTLSKVDSSTAYLKEENFDLCQLVEEVRLHLDSLLRHQGATLTIRLSTTPFPMRGDRFYWSQILFNLLENALKNNPEPGLQLRLQAQQLEDGSLRISVEDNGIGIPQNAIPFIFNRFYRADQTGKIKGTGLGLAIVRHAVEAHSGIISAESIPGLRTAFTITLPAPRLTTSSIPPVAE